MDDALLNAVVVFLVDGMPAEYAIAACIKKGCSQEEAEAIVGEARRRLAQSATFDRDEQVGKARRRLESIYSEATRRKDTRTALQAQRELCKLLDLHSEGRVPDRADEADDATDLRQSLDMIAGYLRPLALAPDDCSIEELTRIAADTIRDNGQARVREEATASHGA